MVEIITQINNAVNGVVWGPAGLALLFGTGLLMSVRTGFFQFRKMGYWLKHTIGAIFTNKDVTAHTSKEDAAVAALHLRHPLCAGFSRVRVHSTRTSFQFLLSAQLCTIERLYHILPACARSFLQSLCSERAQNALVALDRPTGPQKTPPPPSAGDRAGKWGRQCCIRVER